jgi:hypothetical protein
MLTPFFAHERALILRGDCIHLADTLPENSVDALVTDPPAGISFMGKGWDGDKGGMSEWVAWLAARLAVAFRVMKPGAHGLVWAIPRTSHWTALAIEAAGFEIRDRVSHFFGNGFPKSIDVARQIDIHLCTLPGRHYDKNLPAPSKRRADDHLCPMHPDRVEGRSALKPACEDWWLIRKPLEGTVAENVLRWGTGRIMADSCRIAFGEEGPPPITRSGAKGEAAGQVYGTSEKYESVVDARGRWPAHITFDEEAAALLDEQSGELGRSVGVRKAGAVLGNGVTLGHKVNGAVADQTVGYGDSGGASRFFYVAKGSRGEKDAGLDHLRPRSRAEATGRDEGDPGVLNPRAGAGSKGGSRNFHPTVKPVDLIRWLCRLITPPGGVVLDMFYGSGSHGVAALAEGFSIVGCEADIGEDDAPAGYMDINVGRTRHALGLPALTESVYPAEQAAGLVRSA